MTRILSFVRSNAVAFLALFVALGGTSYAAVSLPRNSVTTQQIAPNAVRSGDVKNGSLLAADFRAGQLPPGATGPAGPAGPAGRSALDALKPGETVRGRMGGDYEAAAAGGDWRVFVSFPIPASAPPTGVYFDGVTPGETCAGTTAAPTAPAGSVCIYPVDSYNPALGPATHVASYNAFGFWVSWSPTMSGDTLFQGTWAYTQA